MLVDMPELKVPRFEVRLVKHDPDHAWEPIRITETAQIVDIMAPVVTKLDREMFFVNYPRLKPGACPPNGLQGWLTTAHCPAGQ